MNCDLLYRVTIKEWWSFEHDLNLNKNIQYNTYIFTFIYFLLSSQTVFLYRIKGLNNRINEADYNSYRIDVN